ncbi:hypothetical protein MKZ21_30930, partial [Paenibacillus sp. FSL P2-0536]|uniref:hypothetical protein n=1 Tax=Paenibacillus sp. FSL P2-0536 TaxID=2921629 RepID=UPI0030F7AFC4
MKSYRKVVFMFVIVLSFAFGGQTFAATDVYTQSIIAGKAFFSSYTRQYTYNLTDGDLKTEAATIEPNTFVMTLDMDKKINVKGYRIYANVDTGIEFYNDSALVARQNGLKNGVLVTAKDFKDVNKIVVTHTGSVAVRLYEVEVFGTFPYTENPEPEKFVINNLKANIESSSSVVLEWNAIISDFLKGYNVYKNDVLIREVSGISTVISGLNIGDVNRFKVKPLDIFGKEYVGKTIEYTIPLPTPTPKPTPTPIPTPTPTASPTPIPKPPDKPTLSVTSTEKRIIMDWTNVGADKYLLYRDG